MVSSEDFKKLYELYQTEGVPNGVSIVDFCQRNKIGFVSPERRYEAPTVGTVDNLIQTSG